MKIVRFFRFKQLNKICRINYGKGLSKKDRKAGDVPVMGSNGQVDCHDTGFTNAPCIVIGRKGSIGQVHFVQSSCWPIDTAYYLDEWNGEVDPEFLFFYLQTVGLNSKNKAAAIPSLLRPDLETVEVPLPSLEEQRRIIARIKECLERVEEIGGLRTEAIEEAAATLPSMLNQAFLDLGDDHEKVEIGDVAVETRYGTSRKCSSEPEGTAILRIPNVAGGFVNFEGLKYCSLDEKELKKIALKNGDLLFVRTNGSRDLVGRCAIYEGNGDDREHGFASYLIRVRLDQGQMRPHYLAFFLNSTQGRSELDKRRRTSAGQFNINSENLRNIRVPLPPVDVQDRAIEALRDRQAQVVQLQTELRDAQETESHLRESILRKAFAGEL